MPSPLRARRFAAFSASSLTFALALAACKGSAPAATPPPQPLALTSFDGSIVDDNRLVITATDGRVLLDGLPPASIATDAPPLTGFAVIDQTTTFDMEFGAFKPTVTNNGPWRSATKLVRSADAHSITLEDATGAVLASLAFTEPETGHLVVDISPGAGPEHHFTWGFACDADDHFSGFGAQSFDVDHRGFTVPTWVQEQGIGKVQDDLDNGTWFIVGARHASYSPIPQYLSRRGYILTTETNRRSIIALCSETETTARVEVDLPVKIHVFDGPKPADAIARATNTFGRPRMPPNVTFAPWLDAIFGSANVRAVAAKLRANGIPTGIIWTEDWRGGDWSGDDYSLKEEWQVDTTLYPDMPQLTSDLHGEGFDFLVYFNSFVYQSSQAWAEVQPHGWLVKQTDGTDYTFLGAKFTTTGMLDLDNPDARAWAVSKMQAAIALGADGWMNDFAEWLPPDGTTAAGGSSYDRHNVYPLLWQQVARTAIDGVNDGQERLFFSRSAWLGTAPLADAFWAGDQRTDFEVDDGLPTVVPIGIGLGLVGISTFGHDIGGYQSATNPVSTKELFFRWTELGAWSPVMRTHHGTEPKLEWNWQSDADTTAHFKRYAIQHMALVPYLEGLAQVATTTGLPMWRGLAIDNAEDAKVWPIVDEVMLGDGILVAPVMTQGATSRSVYLPAGTWIPWAAGDAIAVGSAGMTVTAQAAVTEIPIYAKAGTVVPMYPDGVMTLVHGSAAVPDASSVGDDRVIAVFLGASGSFAEAGGLSYAVTQVAAAAASTGALTMTWNGTDVPACGSTAVAPCFGPGTNGAVAAQVTGPGTLAVSAGGTATATIVATGGSATRKLTFSIRR